MNTDTWMGEMKGMDSLEAKKLAFGDKMEAENRVMPQNQM